jgi:hypothetical protein
MLEVEPADAREQRSSGDFAAGWSKNWSKWECDPRKLGSKASKAMIEWQ